MGGHLAAPSDSGVGEGNGASQFPGGSLHMKLLSPSKDASIQASAITPEPPIDVCPNISGDQATVPDKYELVNGECTPIDGILTVTKAFSIPDDAEVQVEVTGFSFSVNGGSAVNFENDGSNNVNVPAGIYSVTETNPGVNWSVSYSEGCNGTMEPAGQATCVITNTYIPPDYTTIKIIKDVKNDNGGIATKQNFYLKLDGNQVISDQTTVVEPGDHTIDEVGLAGYEFVSITGEGCPTSLGETFTMTEGQDLVCTITNDDIGPSLKLIKNVNGGSASPTYWKLSILDSNNDVVKFGYGVVNKTDLQVGTYKLVEEPDPTKNTNNYQASAWNCPGFELDGNQITLGLGDVAECTITNTYQEPEPQTGTIEVCKYEDTDGDGAIDGYGEDQTTPINPLSGWTINITDGDQYNDSKVTGENGCVEFTNLPYTTYTITETQQSGWTQTYPGNNNHIEINLNASRNWAYFLNYYPIYGCTDPEANNYNREATVDDKSCTYEEEIPGCTDPNALNYDQSATQDDGSCRYSGGGGGPVPTYNPSISIAKTGDASVVPGGVGNFSLTVTNTGNAVATNVVVTDTLPAGFTFTDNNLNTHTWNLGNLNVGQVEVINYSVNVPTDASGQYTNIATVSIDGSTVAPYYAEDDYQFTAVQVLGFETQAEEPEEPVQVLGYEALPETGGPVAASNFTWFGALMLMAGAYLIRRYNV